MSSCNCNYMRLKLNFLNKVNRHKLILSEDEAH